jgi:hypothetical protein
VTFNGNVRTHRGWFRICVLAGTMGLALSAGGATSAGAGGRFPSTGFSPTSGIALQPVNVFGERFYGANFVHLNWNGTQTIVLAGNQDGTGSTLVDDMILIRVKHPDGSTKTFSHDYSNGCTINSELLPVDVTRLFAVGNNRVNVALEDACGGEVGSNAIWITAG